MTEKPQETEGIIKGGKREPVARDDEGGVLFTFWYPRNTAH